MRNLAIFDLDLFGSHFIEASAGTGKTYAITELYLRALLHHLENPQRSNSTVFEVKSILVITFTKAATSELFHRIRQKINEALIDRLQSSPFAQEFQLRFGSTPLPQVMACLTKAKEEMDQAHIRTIDAWCQQILREYSWYSQVKPSSELCTNEDELWQEATLNYWREECYSMAASWFAKLVEIWPSADKLEKAIAKKRQDLAFSFPESPVQTATGKSTGESLSSVLANLDFPTDKKKVKASKTYNSQVLLEHAYAKISAQVKARKIAGDSWTYQDYLQKVYDLLIEYPEMLATIRQKYSLVMIDEFQDTSKLQFELFKKIYAIEENRTDCGLFMIGDPKQSIYAFRGADLDNYLVAKEAVAEHRVHYLNTNFRSTNAVVDIVNHWFKEGDVINATNQGAFGYGTKIPFLPVQAQGKSTTWQDTEHEHASMVMGFMPQVLPRQSAEMQSATHCAQQIVHWLNDPLCGFQDSNTGFLRLEPNDIAVLVFTGSQAAKVRWALKQRGLNSVYLSEKDSVFDSIEAQDLYSILIAVLEPYHAAKVRAALLCATIGYDLPTLDAYLGEDAWLQKMQNLFYPLREIWLEKGIMAMLWQLIHSLNLLSHWSMNQERRLTNLFHLGRLIMQEASAYPNPQAQLNWYAKQVFHNQATEPSDNNKLRLESDANLVQVLTIHKSKGLQFPLVALPFLPFTDLRKNDTTQEMCERTRLWYVALTRAKFALWVAWYGLSKKSNQGVCLNHKCSAGRLMASTQVLSHTEWLSLIQQFFAPLSDKVQIDILDPAPFTRYVERELLQTPKAACMAVHRPSIDQTISYSSLVDTLNSAEPKAGHDDEPLLNLSVALEPKNDPELISANFKGGAQIGTFIHQLLEWMIKEPNLQQNPSRYQAHWQLLCEQNGYGVESESLRVWLNKCLSQTLPIIQENLSHLPLVTTEMAFNFATQISVQQLDGWCQKNIWPESTRVPLYQRDQEGLFTGVIDLVFVHAGQYWVLDYKSNFLGNRAADYDLDSLKKAVLDHRYELQVSIYMLALHRLLKIRLGRNYDPNKQLGGALLYFLRGVETSTAGIIQVPLNWTTLKELDPLFTPKMLLYDAL